MERRVRQDYTISPKLNNKALEDVLDPGIDRRVYDRPNNVELIIMNNH